MVLTSGGRVEMTILFIHYEVHGKDPKTTMRTISSYTSKWNNTTHIPNFEVSNGYSRVSGDRIELRVGNL